MALEWSLERNTLTDLHSGALQNERDRQDALRKSAEWLRL